MTCEWIQDQLVSFQFGVVDEATRRDIEEHLVGCTECLRSFLTVKRTIETANSSPLPSPALRDRLRASVARELGVHEPSWSWWERPLAFGVAGAVTLVAVFTVSGLAKGPEAASHDGVNPPVTTASPAPEDSSPH
jgi:hypothetical protein